MADESAEMRDWLRNWSEAFSDIWCIVLNKIGQEMGSKEGQTLTEHVGSFPS